MSASSKNWRPTLKAILYLEIASELKEIVGQLADTENLPVNEYVARLLAKHIKRPDLALIPRKKMGRPRKELSEATR